MSKESEKSENKKEYPTTFKVGQKVEFDEKSGTYKLVEEEPAKEPTATDESAGQGVMPQTAAKKTEATSIPAEKAEPLPETNATSQGNEEIAEVKTTGLKENKRLSAETLFNFALPEAVKDMGVTQMIQVSAEASGAKAVPSPEKEKEKRKGVGLLWGLVVILLLAVAGGVAYFSWQQRNAVPVVAVPQAISMSSDKIQSLSDKALGTLIGQADSETLSRAVQQIAQRKDPALFKKLLGLSKHPDFVVRANAVKVFSESSSYPTEMSEDIYQYLVASLKDSSYLVRGFAARALSAFGDQRAVPELESLLESEDNQIVQSIIPEAIKKLKKAEAN